MRTDIDWKQIEGTTRKRDHLLANLETRWINKLVPLIPSFIETYHLTWSSIFSSLIIFFASFLARNDIRWLWLTSLGIVIHYLTDALDGEVGRRRKTGLIKWGFYVDHFLDFIYASAVISGYSFIFPEKFIIFFLLLIVFAGHFINEFLKCITLGNFKTSGYFGISGTEMSLATVVFNALIVLFGKNSFEFVFGLVFIAVSLGLLRSFYKTQRLLWKIEMKRN